MAHSLGQTLGMTTAGASAADVRVVIIATSAIVRAGLRQIFAQLDAPIPTVVADYLGAGLRGTQAGVCDVVVVERDACPTPAEIRTMVEHFGARILVLSSCADPSCLRDAFASGARGFLERHTSPSELVAAVRTLAEGRDYLHPTLAAALLRRDPEGQPFGHLSGREREVVQLVALGHTQREIAAKLALSVRTIETHLLHIRSKLGVFSRAELVRFAIQNRMLDQRPPSRTPPS